MVCNLEQDSLLAAPKPTVSSSVTISVEETSASVQKCSPEFVGSSKVAASPIFPKAPVPSPALFASDSLKDYSSIPVLENLAHTQPGFGDSKPMYIEESILSPGGKFCNYYDYDHHYFDTTRTNHLSNPPMFSDRLKCCV